MIVGKWEHEMTRIHMGTELSYEFFNDGTYRYFNSKSGVRTNARYTTSGNILTYHFEDGGTAKSEFVIRGDTLTLTIITPERGKPNDFTRVWRKEERQADLYNKLLSQKASASTEEKLRELAKQFKELSGYKNSNELSRECENQYRVLKYNRLVSEMNNEKTEFEWQNIAQQFRELNGYENSNELASECEDQYRVLKKSREDKELKQSEKETIIKVMAILFATVAIISWITIFINNGGAAGLLLLYLTIHSGVFSVIFFSGKSHKALRIIFLIAGILWSLLSIIACMVEWNTAAFVMSISQLASYILAMIFPRRSAKKESAFPAKEISTGASGGGYTGYTGGGYTHPLLTTNNMAELVRNGESCSTCDNRIGDCPYEHKGDKPNIGGVGICHKHSKM